MTFPAKNIVNNDLIGQMILADSTVLLERERERERIDFIFQLAHFLSLLQHPFPMLKKVFLSEL